MLNIWWKSNTAWKCWIERLRRWKWTIWNCRKVPISHAHIIFHPEIKEPLQGWGLKRQDERMESGSGAHGGSVLALQAALVFTDACQRGCDGTCIQMCSSFLPDDCLKNGEDVLKVSLFGAICLHFKERKKTSFHVCVICFRAFSLIRKSFYSAVMWKEWCLAAAVTSEMSLFSKTSSLIPLSFSFTFSALTSVFNLELTSRQWSFLCFPWLLKYIHTESDRF